MSSGEKKHQNHKATDEIHIHLLGILGARSRRFNFCWGCDLDDKFIKKRHFLVLDD